MAWQRPPPSSPRLRVGDPLGRWAEPAPGARPTVEGPIPRTQGPVWPTAGPEPVYPPGTVLGSSPYRVPRFGGGTALGVFLVIASLVLLSDRGLLDPGAEEPVHEAGPRRGPPHVVRATTRPGVWSELSVVDGQRGGYRGQFVHSVKGRLHVEGRHVCARPLLYLNGRLMVRGYLRCGCETLRFNAWSTTRELPYYGPKGATFSLVWTDRWSRAHPAWRFQ
jgi:hypothetical protein